MDERPRARIGLCGLGQMGLAVATRLATRFDVVAVDVDPERRALADTIAGVSAVEALEDVAEQSTIVLSLPTPAISVQVCSDLAGMLASGCAGDRDEHRLATRHGRVRRGAGAGGRGDRRRGHPVRCGADGVRSRDAARRRRRGRRRPGAAGAGRDWFVDAALRRARYWHGRQGGQQRRRPCRDGRARRGLRDGQVAGAGRRNDRRDAGGARRWPDPPADAPDDAACRPRRLRRWDAARRGAQGLDARPGDGPGRPRPVVRDAGGAHRVRPRRGRGLGRADYAVLATLWEQWGDMSLAYRSEAPT